jgi:hypothetical protein
MTTTGESPPSSATPDAAPGTGPLPVGYAPRPSLQFPRKGPALIFLAVVGVVAIGGFLLAALSSGPKAAPAPIGKVPGANISAASAASYVAKIAVAGEPPTNVIEALVVPADATLTKTQRENENLELFAGSISLSAPYQASDIITFYRLELAHEKWKVTRTDATANGKGSELFATIAGSDGFYWELEVIVESSNPSVSPALGGGDATVSSSVSLQLVELDDADCAATPAPRIPATR